MKKTTTKKVRSLKIYPRVNSTKFGKYQVLPEIRLKGNWLNDWGFPFGKQIEVIKTKDGILIRNSDQIPPVIIL